MDDLLSEFLTETGESLAVLDVELIKLERNPNDPELLSNIFRLLHTIKGTCGFLGLPRLEAVAHAGENVLGRLRDGAVEASPEIVSLILECLDTIRAILAALEAGEAEPEGDDGDLIGRLNRVFEGGTATAPETSAEATALGSSADEATASTTAQPMAPPAPRPQAAPQAIASESKATERTAQERTAQERMAQERAVQQRAAEEPVVASQSIRVNVGLLETLMTMVSELVLTRNQLLQILRGQPDSDFAAPLQRLNHVVSELQEGVMKTRMQPIGNAWAKLPRIVRDLSRDLDKKIELVMKGEETELDRQVLELIKDPLTHMVRNSADHGLEEPAGRRAAGKPEVGTISLNAYHEGGQIVIEIVDDGRGLSMEKVRRKCIEKGHLSEAQAAAMSEQQIMQQIFRPGFSTAEKVTAVSGRGVGMDVVRANIEKIGGTIELNSREGKGTNVTIKIPLTLAIVSALIVECAGERFAVPQVNVIELVRVSARSGHEIERINETPVLRLRNRLLPLISLRQLLCLDEPGATDERPDQALGSGSAGGEAEGFVIVSQVGAQVFGILVDQVFDTEEIVVKPVAPILRDIRLFSGSTILGDGRVVMILDPNGIASVTGDLAVGENAAEALTQVADTDEDKVAMLVFRAGDETPKAVPLALIARLEEIHLDRVEVSGGKSVIQYRGQLMPLVRMAGTGPLADKGRQAVLVFTDRDRTMGLVVDEILDIVEDRMQIELGSAREGFIGSAVIAGVATDVVDTGSYLSQAFDDWFGSDTAVPFGSEGHGRRVLLVDDSPFFRNLLSPLLAVAGYEVTAVESAASAIKLRDDGERFDVIVSDIEMPEMNGFEFAKQVRGGAGWADTPLVALSSHATPLDLARGRQVGFHDYVAKFDRDALLNALHDTLVERRGAA